MNNLCISRLNNERFTGVLLESSSASVVGELGNLNKGRLLLSFCYVLLIYRRDVSFRVLMPTLVLK